jgi:hypothetical protein
MRLNMGTWDRRLRAFLIAPALVVVGLLVGPGGVLSIVLYALAAVMVGTAAVGSCPLYMPFGIKTRSRSGATGSVGAAR